jgi:hypothetical protein
LLECGIIMPISAMDDIEESHWLDVRIIIEDAISKAGFKPRLVSDSDQSRFIHNTIITNLYNDEIVVCDVSAKNPNVMFELGLRLAFNKPVVIIIDDSTKFNFDIGILSHLPYRRDLRHRDIEKFKDDLTKLINNTHLGSKTKEHRPFLSHFGEVKSGEIGEGFSKDEFLFRQIDLIGRKLDNLMSSPVSNAGSSGFRSTFKFINNEKFHNSKNIDVFNIIINRFSHLEERSKALIAEIVYSMFNESQLIDMTGDVYSQLVSLFEQRKAEIDDLNLIALESYLNRYYGGITKKVSI